MLRYIHPFVMADAVRRHTVKRGESRVYHALFFIGVAVVATALVVAYYMPDAQVFLTKPAYLGQIDFIIAALIVPVSLGVAWIANQHGDGKDFWYRFTAIGFSTTVLITVLSILLAILGYSEFTIDVQGAYSYNEFIITNSLQLVDLLVSYLAMRRASTGKAF